MEQFDVLDRAGRPTGLTANKGTILPDEHYYLGIHAYILNSRNSFLVQQRAFDKEFLPGGWDVHLGHVIAGESSVDCAIREIREEIGLDVLPDELRLVARVLWDGYHHMIDIYFVNIEYSIQTLILQESEVIGAKEVSINEMLDMVAAMDYRPTEYREIVKNEILKLHSVK